MNKQNAKNITFISDVTLKLISSLFAKRRYSLLNISLVNMEKVIKGAYHSEQKEVGKLISHFSFYSSSPVILIFTRSRLSIAAGDSQVESRSIGAMMTYLNQIASNTIEVIWQNTLAKFDNHYSSLLSNRTLNSG